MVLVPVIAAEVAASQSSTVAVLRAAIRVDGVPAAAVGSTPGQALPSTVQTGLVAALAAELGAAAAAAPGAAKATTTRVAPLLSARLVPGNSSSSDSTAAAVLLYVQISATSPAPWVSSDSLEAVLSSAAVSAALPPGYSALLHSAEAADRQAPAGYAPASDTVPPQLRLVGDSELTVAVLESYEDSGAVCSDSAEGALTDAALLTVGLPLSTEQATPQDTPALVLYGCADAAGNVAATVVRRVTVYDPCQEQGEATCKDTGACSLAGSCKASAARSSALKSSSAYEGRAPQALRSAAVVDRTPPVIAILDPSPAYLPGVDYSTGPSGTARASGRITWVLANTEFSDPGAMALDAVDGDVSASLARHYPAEGPLDTRVPRADSDPYLITYIATDSAGNRAIAFRRVYVVCPQGERVCDADETIDGTVACSSGGGICGVPGIGSGSQFRWQDSNTLPELKLEGDALVAMVADGEGGYAPCTRQSGFRDLCDPGATATDAEDGNLGPLVRACGALFGGSDGYGGNLAACGLNTAVPGDYVINFTVVDSGGASAWAARTLRICPRDEVVCDDLSCSTDGVCSLLTGLNGGSASGLASIVSTIADSPTLNLLENDVVRGSVQLPRGRSYRLCQAGQRATAEAPCDPGIYAVSRLGANITGRVYACPPDACFLDGIACSGHEFWKKDLAGCVNSTAAEGSTQEIRFVVFDRWARLPRVTASRQVLIVSPCSKAGEVYCEEDGKCGTVACDVRKTLGGGDAAVAALAALPPVLLLVDGSRIGPDMSAAVNVASLTNATTLTSLMNSSSGALLNTTQHLAYPACPSELLGGSNATAACAKCSPEALTAGTCGPGVYGIRYSVSDSGSNAASLLRLVTVEERAVLDLAFFFSATLPLSPAPSPPPASNNAPAVDGTGGGESVAAGLTTAERFAGELQRNASLQAQLAASYLPSLGVDPTALRQLNITAVTVINATLAPSSSASIAVFEVKLTVRLSATTMSFGGLGSVGAPNISCATPALDPTAVAVASLSGAVGSLLDMAQQVSAAVTAAGAAVSNIDDQWKARDATVADAYASMQDLAASAVADASAKADTVLRLVMATLAAQNASATSMDAAALLLTLALQEAQESARRANLTAEIIASGLDDSYYGAEELQQLNDCLTARGEYLLDDFATVAPARTVGASGSRVVAGLFLHQRRIPAASLQDLYGGCASDGRFPQRLAAECGSGYSRTVGGPGQQGPSVGGIGVDPVFNRRSQLYSSDLAARIGDYYNATPGSGEVNPNGAPYGFFPSPVSLPGLGSDAYPVLFDTSLTEKRALQALLALSEGAYLDRAMTESLSAQLVSYSSDLRVFGFWRGEFRWGAEGAVRATLRTRGLPAIDWRASAKSGKTGDIAIDLALVALVLAYCVTTVYDVVISVREQRARARAARQLADVASRSAQLTSGASFRAPSFASPEVLMRRGSGLSVAQMRSFVGRSNRVASLTGPGGLAPGTSVSRRSADPDSSVHRYNRDPMAAPWMIGEDSSGEEADGPSKMGFAIGEATEIQEQEGEPRGYDAAALSSGGLVHSNSGGAGAGTGGGLLITGGDATTSPRRPEARLRPVPSPSRSFSYGLTPQPTPSVSKRTMGRDTGIMSTELYSVRSRLTDTNSRKLLSYAASSGTSFTGVVRAASTANLGRNMSMANLARSASMLAEQQKPPPPPPPPGAGDDVEEVEVLGKKVRKYRARMTLFWGTYETALSGLMAACLGLLFSYSRHVASGAPRQPRYDVYDADGYAQARYFMLRRDTSAAAAALNASANAPLAGEPGRWSLPEDAGPLTQLADMYDQVRFVYTLVVILVVVLVMLSAVLVTMWGSQVAELSNMASAVEWMVAYFFSGMGMSGGNQVITDLLKRASVTNDAYVLMAWVFGLAGPLVLVFILPQFLMALLAWPFCELKIANRYEPLVSDDLKHLAQWYYQRLFRRAPHNKAIALLIERLTARQRSAGAIAALRRSFAASFATADTMRRNLQHSFTAARRADVAYRAMVVDVGEERLSAPQLAELLRSLRMKALPEERVSTRRSAEAAAGLRGARGTTRYSTMMQLLAALWHKDQGAPAATKSNAASDLLDTPPSSPTPGASPRTSEDGGQPSAAVVLERMVAAQLVRRLGEMKWHKERQQQPQLSQGPQAGGNQVRTQRMWLHAAATATTVGASRQQGGGTLLLSRAASRTAPKVMPSMRRRSPDGEAEGLAVAGTGEEATEPSLKSFSAAASVIKTAAAAAKLAAASRRSFQLPAPVLTPSPRAADQVQPIRPEDLSDGANEAPPRISPTGQQQSVQAGSPGPSPAWTGGADALTSRGSAPPGTASEPGGLVTGAVRAAGGMRGLGPAEAPANRPLSIADLRSALVASMGRDPLRRQASAPQMDLPPAAVTFGGQNSRAPVAPLAEHMQRLLAQLAAEGTLESRLTGSESGVGSASPDTTGIAAGLTGPASGYSHSASTRFGVADGVPRLPPRQQVSLRHVSSFSGSGAAEAALAAAVAAAPVADAAEHADIPPAVAEARMSAEPFGVLCSPTARGGSHVLGSARSAASLHALAPAGADAPLQTERLGGMGEEAVVDLTDPPFDDPVSPRIPLPGQNILPVLGQQGPGAQAEVAPLESAEPHAEGQGAQQLQHGGGAARELPPLRTTRTIASDIPIEHLPPPLPVATLHIPSKPGPLDVTIPRAAEHGAAEGDDGGAAAAPAAGGLSRPGSARASVAPRPLSARPSCGSGGGALPNDARPPMSPRLRAASPPAALGGGVDGPGEATAQAEPPEATAAGPIMLAVVRALTRQAEDMSRAIAAQRAQQQKLSATLERLLAMPREQLMATPRAVLLQRSGSDERERAATDVGAAEQVHTIEDVEAPRPRSPSVATAVAVVTPGQRPVPTPPTGRLVLPGRAKGGGISLKASTSTEECAQAPVHRAVESGPKRTADLLASTAELLTALKDRDDYRPFTAPTAAPTAGRGSSPPMTPPSTFSGEPPAVAAAPCAEPLSPVPGGLGTSGLASPHVVFSAEAHRDGGMRPPMARRQLSPSKRQASGKVDDLIAELYPLSKRPSMNVRVVQEEGEPHGVPGPKFQR
ncbi:hypothetical protein GPECTOR_7g1320 [Gonium pectorale]|uniref:Polycystin cation channel PKD1/PKD2 domain-containing protein n=1 Tax=Gonium pectorale TaxID=33097 RepID=A0A150GUP1_GONPE|nr:hypothetical protein GPECTOR_7g1320 [Gonium pectorale]|eukprot:KXZ53422.1 hypothetical protein GPECTOR_7g1320 [Gonium pectorale]